jgi:hypothetical protein
MPIEFEGLRIALAVIQKCGELLIFVKLFGYGEQKTG